MLPCVAVSGAGKEGPARSLASTCCSLVPGARARARVRSAAHALPASTDDLFHRPYAERSRRPWTERAPRPTRRRHARAGRHLGARRGLPLPHPHHAPGAAAPVRPAQGAPGRCPAARRQRSGPALQSRPDVRSSLAACRTACAGALGPQRTSSSWCAAGEPHQRAALRALRGAEPPRRSSSSR